MRNEIDEQLTKLNAIITETKELLKTLKRTRKKFIKDIAKKTKEEDMDD